MGKEYLKYDCRSVPHEAKFQDWETKDWAIGRETGEELVVCQMTTLMWNAWTLFESDTCILWIVNKLAKAAPRRSRVFSWCWLSKRWEKFSLSTCLTFSLLFLFFILTDSSPYHQGWINWITEAKHLAAAAWFWPILLKCIFSFLLSLLRAL